MAVGGLVAVGVADADVLAVAAFDPGLLDDAVAGGENRRSGRRAPVDAGMLLDVAEQRMVAAAEAGGDHAVGDRLAHQELLRALAGLVVVVDDIVVGCLVAVELARLAASGQQRVQHFRLGVVVGVLVLARIEDLEGIAGLDLALEVYVVGVDADQVVDDRARDVIAQRGLVDALIEPHALAVVVIVVRSGDGVGAAHVDRDVFTHLRPGHHRLDRGVGGNDDAYRLQPRPVAGRRQQHAQLVAVARGAVLPAHPEGGGDRLHLVGGGAQVAQDRGDGIALLEHHRALVPGVAAGHLRGGLRHQRHVFRHDARLEAAIDVAVALGGVWHQRGGDGVCDHRGLLDGRAVPVRGFTHARQDLVRRHDRGDLRARQHGGEIAGDERDLGIGLGAGVRCVLRDAFGLRQHLLRVERWDIGGQLGDRQREVAGDAHERPHPHDLAVAAAAHGGGFTDDLAGRVGLAGRRQAVGLARDIGDAVDHAGHGLTQGCFHAFRHGREVGFAIKRSEHGAAHQRGAAQTREDRAAEPLHRDAAAIDQCGILAVDGQRRLVAEIDVLGLQARTECPAAFALIQAQRPPPPARASGYRNAKAARRDRYEGVDWKEQHARAEVRAKA